MKVQIAFGARPSVAVAQLETLGIRAMNQMSVHKTEKHWWQVLVVCFAAYIILATAILVAYKLIGAGPSVAEGCIFWSCLISFAGLFVTGVVLVFWRQLAWGWSILAGTTIAFMLFFWIVLPWLAKAKGYA